MNSINTKKNFNFFRKIWHVIPGVIFSIVYYHEYISLETINDWLIKSFIFAAMFDYLRLRNKKINKFAIKVFSLIIRKEEYFAPSGIPSYLGSILFVTYFFSKPIAILSILYLAFGDPFASFFGIFFKDNPMNYKFENKKSLFGLFGAAIVCLLVTLVCGFWIFEWSFVFAFTVGAVCGFVVACVETFQPPEINDNLLIPIMSAFSIKIMIYLLGMIDK